MVPTVSGSATSPRYDGTGAIGLTVVVCTLNRRDKLAQCLNALSQLSCREPWQLVVVDNGSADGTLEWLRLWSGDPGGGWPDVIHEPRRGTSRARNAGIRASRGSIVAFIDDDCVVTDGYLNALLDAFDDRSIGYICDRVLLHSPEDWPITIRTSEVREHFEPYTVLAPGEILGANFAFRRDYLPAVPGEWLPLCRNC